MAHNKYFQFKEFRIVQEKSAMKVNTDGVLLGAWVNLDGARTILDVGAGTGLISLMIAQRSKAEITGVEIEKDAAEEAFQNVKNSKWSDRIFIQNSSFQDFVAISKSKFDFIVSNPPFFSNGIKNSNPYRAIARHNQSLPFNEIIAGTKKLLGENGKLALILPRDHAQEFIDKSTRENLYLVRLTEVKPFPDKDPNRCLMEFKMEKSVIEKTQMSIYDESRREYTEEFKKLAGDFYLKL